MNCTLTQADCAEIYSALGLARAPLVQLRLGDNCEYLANDWVKVTRLDAQSIYDALVAKRERVLAGAYDSHPGEINEPGSFSFKLAEHVTHILAAVGPMGAKLITKRDTYRTPFVVPQAPRVQESRRVTLQDPISRTNSLAAADAGVEALRTARFNQNASVDELKGWRKLAARLGMREANSSLRGELSRAQRSGSIALSD